MGQKVQEEKREKEEADTDMEGVKSYFKDEKDNGNVVTTDPKPETSQTAAAASSSKGCSDPLDGGHDLLSPSP